MPIYDVFIHARLGEIRTVLADERGRLIQLDIDRPLGARSVCGEIFVGRVTKIAAAIDAAFVDIGTGQAGYLDLKETRPGAGNAPDGALIEGQRMIVQAVRDPVDGKGAKLTARPSLRGRFTALTPGRPGIAFSPAIANKGQRARLRAVIEGGDERGEDPGVSVRDEASDATGAQISADLAILHKGWAEILRDAQKEPAPRRLHRPTPPFAGILEDLDAHEIRRIVCDDGALCEILHQLCARRYRGDAPVIERYDGPCALFETFDLDERVANACALRVALPSGGRLTIEETAALTVIDVDSARVAQKGSKNTRNHALSINIEAAHEAARQIRLRNLSGLIVIDMLKMSTKADRRNVRDTLIRALESDPKKPQVLGFGPSGLLELTRRRTQPPLSHVLYGPWRARVGQGRTPSDDTVAIEALNGVLAYVGANPGKIPAVSARRGVVDALRGRLLAGLRELEGRLGHALVLKVVDGENKDAFRIEETVFTSG
ncbi:ribonuclease E/G [Varunaivibrio sulfuroxidans]|uniref:RNAse G n=1 Tax=Varunaivibrio sulfuroxidans TaxID=1773489 RepID=A0A4V2UN01_9PROT|nr:ribonuclease E/G [Varunaivibrio sulfuroxidans]TCS60151.1 RNAse G [Varunaivibrio sulfuroxidans]WES30877.1 ribonuclease E/G [Varunaivibrio sulfuroxidans]